MDKNELKIDRFIDFNNKYRSTDKGPYFVFIEHKDKNLGKLFPIRVGHYLCKIYKKNILDIKSVGINRVKVILNTYDIANSLIDSEVIKQNNLIAYIPKIFTQKKGIIRNIHPVVQCFKCLRYGHTKILCKSTINHCGKYGEEHDKEFCQNEFQYCVYCKSNDHGSIARSCPIYLKQRRIKEIMAKNNVSFKEAEKIENNPSYSKAVNNNRININNRYDILNTLENFPPLTQYTQTPQTNRTIQNNNLHQKLYHRHSRTQTLTQVTQNKKRKASPIPHSSKTRNTEENKDKHRHSILPNPYREEFFEYKEKLATQITIFVQQLLGHIASGKSDQFNFDDFQIKQSITNFMCNIDPNNSNNDSTY